MLPHGLLLHGLDRVNGSREKTHSDIIVNVSTLSGVLCTSQVFNLNLKKDVSLSFSGFG